MDKKCGPREAAAWRTLDETLDHLPVPSYSAPTNHMASGLADAFSNLTCALMHGMALSAGIAAAKEARRQDEAAAAEDNEE